MRISWSDVSRLPLDEEIETFHIAPADQARVEARVGLLSGQIGALRAGGGRIFLALHAARRSWRSRRSTRCSPARIPSSLPRPGIARAARGDAALCSAPARVCALARGGRRSRERDDASGSREHTRHPRMDGADRALITATGVSGLSRARRSLRRTSYPGRLPTTRLECAGRVLAGVTSNTIPRCTPRDERRAGRSLISSLIDLAAEPKKITTLEYSGPLAKGYVALCGNGIVSTP